MTIFSYVEKRYQDGCITGVARFDNDLKFVFPRLVSINAIPSTATKDDIVIVANHLALNLRPGFRSVHAVHHGSAQTHFDRDPEWRGSGAAYMCKAQRDLFKMSGISYVAPCTWVREQFCHHYSLPTGYARIIPHWVKTFGPIQKKPNRKPVIIGDWRNYNKGKHLIEGLVKRLPQCEFRTLRFNPRDKESFYLDADLFLSLSLSEGFSYGVADAEACEMPIVMTDIGCATEFSAPHKIPWQKRDDLDLVATTIEKALKDGRTEESFYKKYDLERWTSDWSEEVGVSKASLPTGSVKFFQRTPSVVVGITSGIGNAVFALPLLAALKKMGYFVSLYLETDYPMKEIFKRCVYVDQVIERPELAPWADIYISGPLIPKGFHPFADRVKRYCWHQFGTFTEPEWSVLLKGAVDLGWKGGRLDVSGWCRDINVEKKWDVGIASGCKPGDVWERKKYPYLNELSIALQEKGLKVCILGTKEDPPVPGEDLRGSRPLHEMPDLLSQCKVVFGGDSGIVHLAASLGIPSVMIFTATSEVKGDPVTSSCKIISKKVPCSPCQSKPLWFECVSWVCRDIPVGTIIAAIEEKLDIEKRFLLAQQS